MLTILLIILYLVFIGIGLPHNLIGAAGPSMSAGLAVSDAYLGILSMIVMGSVMIACICSGKIRQRLSAGVMTLVGVAMIALSVWGYALSGQFVWLCVCSVPLGLGLGFMDTTLNDFAAVHFKAQHMNWLHCAWGIGATAGPLIMAAGLSRTGSWRTGYYAVGGILAGLALMVGVALPLWKKASGTEASASGKVRFGEVFKRKGLSLSLLAFLLYCALETTVGLWGKGYMMRVRQIPEASATQWIALLFLGITAGRLLSGFLTMKLSNRQIIRLGIMVFLIGMAVTFTPFGNLSAGFILMGIGCAPIFPTLLHNTPSFFGKEHSQSVIGLQMASAYVGAAVVPPLFGVMADAAGYALLPAFLGALLAGMAVLIEALNRKFAKTP